LTVCPLLLSAQARTPSGDAPRWEFAWGGGLHFFGPTRAAAALGGGFRRDGATPSDRSQYLYAFLEPGLGAVRLSPGYAESFGASGSGWSVRASLLKLLSEPSRRAFVGAELQGIVIYCVGSRVGAFRPLERDRGRDIVWLADLSLCL
jgi:hypothetical protein